MYIEFFGFKENPFMPVPNPAYLFLGQSHEEALAHLIYAVSEEEGFVSLIGKRGVGKTTICRAFIERRDENIEVAYIFKPELSPEELLKKINSEFSISDATDDAKELIDALNTFLMQKKVEGKKVVLFIDDAQNLKEDALEQVRLLSNLETIRDKLLQIVLVGEPRLADMLGSHALRQIGQRVSVSCHINPLTYEETRAYIYHRMRVASQGMRVQFEASALKRIYKFSSGIPRMISIVCDKSLFNAYRLNHQYITGEIAKTAILDLTGNSGRHGYGFLNRRRAVAGCGLLLLLMMLALFLRQTDRQAVAVKAEAKPAVIKQPGKPAVMATSSLVPEKRLELPAKMTHSVQIGAFRARKLAKKRVGKLKEKGYPAGILRVRDPKARTWYTVRIGDYSSRDVARQHAESFTSSEKMESAVRPYGKL